MLTTNTQKEYKSRVDSVIDFIIKNLNSDISLQTLAKVANYSPFHLQKVFKQVHGETPKQYAVKLRLQSAFHLILVHPHKSILEIAMDSGFSSASVFSRAMKNYLGISPDKIRSLAPKDQVRILKKLNLNPTHSPRKNSQTTIPESVRITKTGILTGLYLIAPLNEPAKIQQAFKELIKIAKAHDLNIDHSEFYGIISPYSGHTYKAFLSMNERPKGSKKLNIAEINPGKYVTIKTCGETEATMKAIHFIFHKWLPESGYKVADPLVGYEKLAQNPAYVPYKEIEREIHIPVVAA